MDKDFLNWHYKKNRIHNNEVRPLFRDEELWFTSLGANIGSEQDGKGDEFLRPVIIIKKFNNEIFWGIPTTKTSRKGHYYLRFPYKPGLYTTAILSQMKLIDSKRLRYKISDVEKNDFLEMKKRLISFLK